MSKREFAIQSTSTSAWATAAVAGLSLLDSTAIASAQSWTGFYVGISGGYNWQDVKYENPSFWGDASPDGFYGGAFIGYNYHVAPQWVLGVEAGAGFSSIHLISQIGGSDLTTQSPYEITGRIRAGYLVNPQTLVFASGGFATSKQIIEFPGQSERLYRTGYTVGGGIEFGQILRGVHFRTEYVFTDYGSKTFFTDLPVVLSQHAVRFSLSTRPFKVGE